MESEAHVSCEGEIIPSWTIQPMFCTTGCNAYFSKERYYEAYLSMSRRHIWAPVMKFITTMMKFIMEVMKFIIGWWSSSPDDEIHHHSDEIHHHSDEIHHFRPLRDFLAWPTRSFSFSDVWCEVHICDWINMVVLLSVHPSTSWRGIEIALSSGRYP